MRRKSSSNLALRQTARIRQLPIDALVIYDIQDESLRNDAERPFPYSPSIDPAHYAFESLAALDVPKVVYRSVPSLSEAQLSESLRWVDAAEGLAVLVGARVTSANGVSLVECGRMRWRGDSYPELPIGGVLIAERHELRHDGARARAAEDGRRLSLLRQSSGLLGRGEQGTC